MADKLLAERLEDPIIRGAREKLAQIASALADRHVEKGCAAWLSRE
ncbi:hypothetical protein BN2476_780015 [Paraburkholderia piptadeniae]|uniref:Uncharacterized protein n=1 Tax=Paraburkholderia piptadeniae TaxID=1701573 RepID=A0A1N7SSB0_9BURK|nr:hypothetical protein BN2476_780015 [Paraburkholderia piptadeniae]